MKSEQAKELASLTKFKCSQTSAKTARRVRHQRVNTMYNGRFHRPGRLWSLSHATGKTTRLILGLAFPEALSSSNTVCAHTGRMSLIQHSFNKCLLCCLCPLRKPSCTLWSLLRSRGSARWGHKDRGQEEWRPLWTQVTECDLRFRSQMGKRGLPVRLDSLLEGSQKEETPPKPAAPVCVERQCYLE